MKLTILVISLFILVGCVNTNPPEPPKAKGDWQKLTTTVSDINKG